MNDVSCRRVAMISGANRGIGKILSAQLQQAGWLISAGVRDVRSISPSPAVFVHEFDATQHQEKSWVEATLAHYGRIDALIANAGIMIPASIVEISDDDMDAMLTVNLRSPIRLVQAAWPSLKTGGQGRVIILASLSGKRVKSVSSGPYAITKHAAVALAHSIKKAGWQDGIRATAVCPGFVATDMARSITSKDEAEMTQPQDIARMIATVLELPNTANVAELSISCSEEDLY